MARTLNQSNIEQFVDSYLSKYRNANNKRSIRKFVEKAIKQINFFLNNPCCDEDAETTIEYSRSDNEMTRYITAIFNNKVDRRRTRKSLLRTRKLLQNFLNDPCCCTQVELTTTDNYVDILEDAATSFSLAYCGQAVGLDYDGESTGEEIAQQLAEEMNALTYFSETLVGTFTPNEDGTVTYTGCGCEDDPESEVVASGQGD